MTGLPLFSTLKLYDGFFGFCSSQKYLPSSHIQGHKIPFGLMFDIDGVLVRGKKVLSYAIEAFNLLVDSNKNFLVPTVFVTNAGNTLRHQKAESLSSWLNMPVGSMSSDSHLYLQFH